MKILIAIHDFYPPKHYLQPRAFLYRIGLAAVAKGHHVAFLTNVSGVSSIDGLDVLSVDGLSKKHSSQILAAIRGISPDVIVWSTSYTNALANSSLFTDLPAPVFGFLACPFYSATYLLRLLPKLGMRPLKYYFLNCLARPVSVRRSLGTPLFAGLLSQSRSNLRPLAAIPAERRHHIPPGLDHDVWFPQREKSIRPQSTSRRILFFGPARKSRGLDVVLGAFRKVSKEHPGTELALYLREDSGTVVEEVKRRLSEHGLDQRATVTGGWTPADELRSAIWKADIVAIPFPLSESDSPLSILEAKACGRPVLSSAIAGIPELIGGGGIALPSCTARALAKEISALIAEPERLRQLTERAIAETLEHPSWETACDNLISAMEATIDE